MGLTDTEAGTLIGLLKEAREAKKQKIDHEDSDKIIRELVVVDRMIGLLENFVYYVPSRD